MMQNIFRMIKYDKYCSSRKQKQDEIMKIIDETPELNLGEDDNHGGMSILTTAYLYNEINLFKTLVETGMDVNYYTRDGCTTLYELISRSRLKNSYKLHLHSCVNLLIQHGAIVNKCSSICYYSLSELVVYRVLYNYCGELGLPIRLAKQLLSETDMILNTRSFDAFAYVIFPEIEEADPSVEYTFVLDIMVETRFVG